MVQRWAQWLRSELPFVTVVALILASCLYLYLAPGHWRRVSAGIALALLVAGVLRLALPTHQVGLLHVRGRLRDGFTYLLVGGLILVLAIQLH